jgi:putative flippase GtrA
MNSLQTKYLTVGLLNTIIGYLAGVLIYKVFYGSISILLIATVSNIISISISFTTYKIYVFKTNGNWLREYLKAYVVYGLSALSSILLLWLLVEKNEMSIWVAQALTVVFTVFISYFGHNLYTFRKTKASNGS